MKNIRSFIKGFNIEPVASSSIDSEGDVEIFSNGLRVYLQAAVRTLVTTDQAQTLTAKSLSGLTNTFTNIPYSAIILTSSIVNADISNSAAIAYSKLNLASSIVNADISGSAAIAYSKLNLATSVVNADISASAAIAFSKLAALTSGNILVGNVSNVATSVAVSGEATISNAGAVTLANSAVITKVLTGYVSGAGTVAATDSILQAIQKLNGNDAALVAGPASATDNAVARFDSTTGKLVQNSGVTLDDSAAFLGASAYQFGSTTGIFAGGGGAVQIKGNNVVLALFDEDDDVYLNDIVGAKSVDAGNRVLFASDGSTSQLQWGGASVVINSALSLEDPGAGSNTVTIQSPSGLASSYTLTLPVDDGTVGQVLTTDGSGVLSWGAGGSGANAALSNLASVAINASLVPAINDTISVGSGTFRYAQVYTGNIEVTTNINDSTGDPVIGISTRELIGSDGDISIEFGGRQLVDGAVVKLDWSGTNVLIKSGIELEDPGAGTNAVTIQAPSALGASYTLTLPVDDGTSNQVLTTNGSGVLSWSTPSGSGATTALDNLASVAINSALLPGTDVATDIGSATKTWASLYVDSIYDRAGLIAVDIQGRGLKNDSGSYVLSWNSQGVLFPQNMDAIFSDTTGDFTTTLAAGANSEDYQFTLPPDSGSNGQVLTTDGSGVTSWTTVSGGSGVTTMAAIGAVPNADGASISGVTLTLQPANGSFGGVVTTAAQTLAGVKTFSSAPVLSSLSTGLIHADAGGALTSSLLVNADVSGSAAIAYSKLNLATSIVNADISASAAIAYSKLNLASSIVNADVASGAAIAYSKLNLATSIVNADIATAAAIAVTKLANGTANQIIGANAGATANEFKSLASGTSGTDFAIAHSAGTITFNLPDASASARGVITTSTQTIAGDKTLTGNTYLSGGLRMAIVSKTANYTATAADQTILVSASGGAVVITLPAVAGCTGCVYNIKKTDSSVNTVTIDANSAETIDGQLTQVIATQYQCITVQSDGTSWSII